jgi:hypothetical protein
VQKGGPCPRRHSYRVYDVSGRVEETMNFETSDLGSRVDAKRYVFVCGMPRSGTTIIAKEIASLPNCTGFENTGVIMDEGQYLQDVYPTEWACGGAGRFGFDPRSHLTESSPLMTPSNVGRLRQSWEPYWDRNKAICIEKTPGNLLKTLFLQASFPNACFIVLKRHPVAVSLATQKWSLTPLHDLFRHWLRCHEIFDEDKRQLKRLYELSYESYVEDPAKHLKQIAAFIGTSFSGSTGEQPVDSHNRRYFERWAQMLRSSAFKSYYRRVARKYDGRFQAHGYSLTPPPLEATMSLDNGAPGTRGATPLLDLSADIFYDLWRAGRALRIWSYKTPVLMRLEPAVKRVIQKSDS